MCCSAAFFLLYYAVSAPKQPEPYSPENAPKNRRLQQQPLRTTHTSPSDQNKPPDTVRTDTHRTDTFKTDTVRTGDPSLTAPQKAVRIAFYLWLSLLNLLATSTLWARAADAFDSDAASRLFGFLGAGATIGELLRTCLEPSRAFLLSYVMEVTFCSVSGKCSQRKDLRCFAHHLHVCNV